MSVEVERATLPCGVCGAAVTELRRGRCWGCYSRWTESRPVGRGASCTVCQEKRRSHLKLVELKGRSLPFCHICAAQVMRLPEVPDSLEELRHELRRERRDADRRDGKLDQRIFPRERRVGERRGPSRDAFADTDPRIRLGDVDDAIIELEDIELRIGDQTSVRANPLPKAEPPPVPEAVAASAVSIAPVDATTAPIAPVAPVATADTPADDASDEPTATD